jgi:flagellar hook assembly protein FlgD
LLAPYPNPVPGGSVNISFDLPSSGRVSAQVLDVAGHRVRTLAAGREFSAGRQTLEWDGLSDGRGRVPMGVYFIRVQVGGHAGGRRLVLLE